MSTVNRDYFFTIIKPLFNSFTQSQVDGLNNILDYYESQSLVILKQFAYILGTIHLETGATMQPIEEWGKGKGKPYGTNIDIDKKPYFDTKNIFFGRGYTQNTWRSNYIKLTKANGMGWDFFNKPELLLHHEPSIWATFYAMRTGLYTGKKLSDYFNEKKEDWVNARKVVNGLDCSEKIAILANTYLKALS
jgi:putative chitinase